MSKLGCPCGHTIVDQTDDLPYKGRIVVDQLDHTFGETVSTEAVLFAQALAEGQLDAWIRRHFLPGFPKDVEPSTIFYLFLSRLENDCSVQIYECEECGRLLVQKEHGSDQFIGYQPDDDRYHAVLRAQE